MRRSQRFLFMAVLIGTNSSAQIQNSIWYFGEYCGLQFTDGGTPTILFDSSSDATYSCGSICNSNGDLVLYASTWAMWNGSHDLMHNGTGFEYISAAPSPLVVPWPADPDRFFSFGWRYTFNPYRRTMYYQLIDISAFNGQGAVIMKDVVLLDTADAGVAAVPHCNGQDYWIIVQEKGGNTYSSYALTSAGLSTTPVTSAIGRDHEVWIVHSDVLQASVDGQRLAHSFMNSQGWQLDLFDFDPCTGIVSGHLPIGSGIRHDMPEFSPSGQFLYASEFACVQSDTTLLWQYDLSSGDSTQVRATRSLLYAYPPDPLCDGTPRHCALAPNGKIYVALDDTTCLGVINAPDLVGTAADFVYCGQSLGGRRNYNSLPHQVKFPPSPNAISERSDHPEPVRIHPTPASDGIWLDTDLATHLELLDLQGRMVQSARVNGTGPHWLPREGLGAGTYVLRVWSIKGEVIGYGRVVFR